ncbi:pyruvate dehydrogenase (acetyl-transferring) E1 component subunit alpha [Spiroplasma endosymbiont of Anurida maritima]|uniref:pyruvate dehydrogenase (acetyl-transferring) E1 component subunit alpha n=1 Tax=Spiroplasma endosymbiont of Anurida maritima TaxID=2967972 RepID=UPI0036D40DED
MNTKYFGKFDSLKNQKVQIMDETGKIINEKLMPKINKETVIKAYKIMSLSRAQDHFQDKVQKQGRLLSYLTSTGQEACEVAYGLQIKKGKDWFSGAYRNNAAWLASGVPMRNIMLYWIGNEFGSHMPEGIQTLPINIPIATQYSHATGIAFAEKYAGRDGVCLTTTGDGGSSEGEFYEAMNFAQLHEVPAVFMVENNKYAISTPRSKATKAINFAVKGISTGTRNIIVDGNDFFASWAVVEEAMELARKGHGPSLIEFDTYRLGAHSSSDDPKVYRDEKYHQEQIKKDPLIRMKNYLVDKGWWDAKKQKALDEENNKIIRAEFKWVEENANTKLEDIFKYTYAEMTDALNEQMQEEKDFQKYLSEKGGN